MSNINLNSDIFVVPAGSAFFRVYLRGKTRTSFTIDYIVGITFLKN